MSATITPPREGVDRQPTAAPTGKPTEVDLEFTAGSSAEWYVEDQRTRLRRGRLVRFAILIPLWMLSLIPLAREISDGREVVLAYLAVGAVSIGIVIALRGVYVLLTRGKRIWAPSAFLIAAVLGLAGYVVQTGGEEEIPIAGCSPGVRSGPRVERVAEHHPWTAGAGCRARVRPTRSYAAQLNRSNRSERRSVSAAGAAATARRSLCVDLLEHVGIGSRLVGVGARGVCADVAQETPHARPASRDAARRPD